jgi:DNA mismatch repair protein MutS2
MPAAPQAPAGHPSSGQRVDDDVIRSLEFGKVTRILAGYAVTPRGKKRAESLAPMRDRPSVEQALELVSQMRGAMDEGYTLPLGPVEDVSPAAERARAGGGPLEPQLLWRVAECLDAAGRVSSSLRRLGGSWPALVALGRRVPQCPQLVEAVRKAIDASGRVLDGASPELKTIRRRIGALRRRIEEMLRRLIESPGVRPHLQYPNPTMCRDRYVLPVNAYRRHEVGGLVHGSSDSGATLYVEPFTIVEPGNELGEAMGEEEEEVRRILWELTGKVAAECDSVLNAVEMLAEVDVVRAEALMSMAFAMSRPALSATRALELQGARHPLLLRLTCPPDRKAPTAEDLDFDAVVPLDIHLGQDFDVLVITGPNTGGKTVVLKTLGLLCLMARAGMHVPAERASVPLYDAVYADIGDEQSLEQSLSTFSSHMGRIIRILRQATPESLVLLDELGAGTDPTEGTALGEGILKRLVGMGASTVVVTHLSKLKTFAVTRPRVENASMDFDMQTLRPTYRLTVGTVGSSNALEIAERLGLPSPILQDAREALDAESAGQYSSALDEIRLAREDAEERRERMQYLEQQAGELKTEYEQTLARLKAEEARRDAGFGLKMRDDLEALQAEAERLYEDLRHSHRSVAKRVREVRDGLSACLEELERLLEGHRPKRALQPGDEVYVTRMHRWGTVEHIGRDGERARVRVGDVQVEVEVEDLEPWGEGVGEG